jgi:prophage antirepressor-like protein
MTDLINFEYQGAQVRTVTIDGEPWWVAGDVCGVLNISNPSQAIVSLEDDEKSTISNSESRNGGGNILIINEPGLYSLILRSRKPEAKEFKRWITHEVIPQIRKTGSYQLSGERLIAVALIEAQKVLDEKDQKIRQLEPKAQFFDQVANSKTALQMRDVAAALNFSGWGRNKIFALLRQEGILDSKNIPYRDYQDRGYFRVIEQTWTDDKGETHINFKTLVYQRGMDYIRKIIERSAA